MRAAPHTEVRPDRVADDRLLAELEQLPVNVAWELP